MGVTALGEVVGRVAGVSWVIMAEDVHFKEFIVGVFDYHRKGVL